MSIPIPMSVSMPQPVPSAVQVNKNPFGFAPKEQLICPEIQPGSSSEAGARWGRGSDVGWCIEKRLIIYIYMLAPIYIYIYITSPYRPTISNLVYNYGKKSAYLCAHFHYELVGLMFHFRGHSCKERKHFGIPTINLIVYNLAYNLANWGSWGYVMG